MKHLIAKEIRDLAPAAIAIELAAAVAAVTIAWSDRYPLPSIAPLCATVGASLGLIQGILDRRRRDDPFLLHRPVSAERIHAVRGLASAGLAACIAATCVTLARLAPYRGTAPVPIELPGGGSLVDPAAPSLRADLTLEQSLMCVAGALVFHSVVRLALTPRRWLASALLVVVLPVMVVYALLSIGTDATPWLAFAAVAGVASTLSFLEFARRPA